MTIVDEVRNIEEWSKQTKAVAAHLEERGAIYKHDCTRGGGIPGYGIIEHPGARIFDLREKSWKIRTETRPTRWVLIAKPDEQLPLDV
jgi:hypothetical protein